MRAEQVGRLLLTAGFVLGAGPVALHAAEKESKPAAGGLVVVDDAGKEHTLKDWKFVAGTMHLSWLAPVGDGDKAPQGKAFVRRAVGPEALEFTEKTGLLARPILTLVPLEHVRAIEFDNDKKTVTLRVAKTADSDEVLHGVLGYVGVNVVAVESEAKLGDLGTATIKYQGGVKRGVRSIRFPSPKPLTAVPAVRPAEVVAVGKGKEVHNAADLRPLYLYPDGMLHTRPELLFKKDLKVDLDRVQKLSRVGDEGGSRGLVFDVALKDGQQNPLVLVEGLVLAKGRVAFLQGLVGRVPVGYKLFPMQDISELVFEAGARPENPTPAPK